VMPLQPGPVAVQRKGKWQYVVAADQSPVPANLRSAFSFSGGFAVAEDAQSGKVGFINRDGFWAIPPQFTFAGDFDRGHAVVKFGDSICWVNQGGKLIWAPQNFPVQEWETQIAAKRCGEKVGAGKDIFGDEEQPLVLGEVVGVYRSRVQALAEARVRSGAEVIVDAGRDSESHFVYATDLSMFFSQVVTSTTDYILAEDDLRAAVHYARSGDLEATLTAVNTTRIADDLRLMRLLWRDAPSMDGKLQVAAPSYFECGENQDPVKVEWHSIGGKLDQPEVAEELLPSPQRNQDGSIDYWSPRTFEAAFDGTFEDGRPFSEGLASARKGGLYGFIDLTGNWVIPPTYANTSLFSEGIAMVVDPQTRQLGGVDRDGKVVLAFQPHALGDFHQGRALIIRDEK